MGLLRWMDELTVELLTATVTYLNVAVCLFTLPLTLFTLIALINARSTFNNAFFTFYKVGLATDVVAIVTSLTFGVAPALGWFVEQYTATDVPMRLFYFFNWFTRIIQGSTNTYICLNRASAALVPLLHYKIWGEAFVVRALIVFQVFASFVLGLLNTRIKAEWQVYHDGRAFLVKYATKRSHLQYLGGFLLIAGNIAILVFLYTIILVRLKLTESSIKKHQPRDKKARSLLYIAVFVVSLELIYCVYFYFAFVDDANADKDRRIFMTKYFVVTEAYSILPTYILLFFSASLRKEMRSYYP